jgi:hypothetical protein
MVAEVLISMLGGWAAIVVPVAGNPAAQSYDSGFMPLMRNAIESMAGYSPALLFGWGMVLGAIAQAPSVLLGAASMAAFPVWSAIDLSKGGGHNLLPFEWLEYAFLAAITTAGVVLGRRVRLGSRGL